LAWVPCWCWQSAAQPAAAQVAAASSSGSEMWIEPALSSCSLCLLLLAATTANGEAAASASEPAAAGGPPSWKGRRWHTPPQYTPTCVPGGIFPNAEQDPTRTFSCSSADPSPPEFEHPVAPPSSLPPYVQPSHARRDFHHMPDGPLAGNGNLGVLVGGGNSWNDHNTSTNPWIDLFLSTNSFWALTGANHSTGTPFRGRDAVPSTLLLGVTRIGLPASFTGCDFSAEQDIATATVHVNLTSKAGVTVSVSLFVSPLSPSVWTTVSTSGTATEVAVTLSTTVLSHFYHREQHVNTTFPVQTSAVCGASGATSTVTRASDFAESDLVITGAIQHTTRSSRGGRDSEAAVPPSCHVTGSTEATLSFTLVPQQPISIVSVVRTSKDPECVPRPDVGGSAAPLCGLSSNATLAAEAISRDLSSVTLEQAAADHAASWKAFWAVSSISLPSAPETEAFWWGAQYVLNSAIPHAGQEQTPPGLYGPWGSQDNPGWHGDYTIDYSKLEALRSSYKSVSPGSPVCHVCSRADTSLRVLRRRTDASQIMRQSSTE
jgi:hypothetical protein